jgi:hypothetical protein
MSPLIVTTLVAAAGTEAGPGHGPNGATVVAGAAVVGVVAGAVVEGVVVGAGVVAGCVVAAAVVSVVAGTVLAASVAGAVDGAALLVVAGDAVPFADDAPAVTPVELSLHAAVPTIVRTSETTTSRVRIAPLWTSRDVGGVHPRMSVSRWCYEALTSASTLLHRVGSVLYGA